MTSETPNKIVAGLREAIDHAKAAHCQTCGDPVEGLHLCPFQDDVHHNADPEFCNCCDVCRRECAANV